MLTVPDELFHASDLNKDHKTAFEMTNSKNEHDNIEVLCNYKISPLDSP